MLYTINELRDTLLHQVYKVYDLFRDYYGEEHTDLKYIPSDEYLCDLMESLDISESDTYENNYEISDEQLEALRENCSSDVCYILIWWPHVTVSNENNRSIDIYDLYARIPIDIKGRIPYEQPGFELMRTTFTYVQYHCGYVHSHLRTRGSEIHFDSPCLGSGPIKNTIGSLRNDFDMYLWMLFCHELSLYVTVESLNGGPYIKLETVRYSNTLLSGYNVKPKIRFRDIPYMEKTWLNDFAGYYLNQGTLPISFSGDSYDCTIPPLKLNIDMSRAFISWYNLYGRVKYPSINISRITRKVVVRDGKVYQLNKVKVDTSAVGSPLISFKGQMIRLNLIPDPEEYSPDTLLLDCAIVYYLLNQILTTINYHYNHESDISHTVSSDGVTESASTTRQKVLYVSPDC